MARKPYISDDDWHKEPDSKKRKQIQDRLAQRARRQRLRDAKNNAKHAPQCTETQATDEAQHVNESHAIASFSRPDLFYHDTFKPSSWESKDLLQSTESYLDQSLLALPHFDIGNAPFCALSTVPVPSPLTSPPAPITVFGAMYINGRILGLKCSVSVPARSLPVLDDIPWPLHPTEMQLTTIHAHWIDRIPLPKMRDNLIVLFSKLDDEEIIADLFTMPSFSITPGHASWDPHAWKIEKPFADKWGYLLT